MANGKQRVTDIITTNDIRSWTPRDTIIISAGTGTGKSYFVKNSLYQYAKENNKKILFLIHRSNCVSQFQSEIERDGKTDVIDILTYQKIEHNILHYNQHKNYKEYAYIVCDEFHYFISDANFNNTTDISFKEIMSQNCTKILMSATGEDVERYLSSTTRRRIRRYKLSPNYEHVSALTFFLQDEDIDYLAETIILKHEKAIIFIQSAEKAYKLFKKFSEHSLFNCSKNNSKHYKYVDEEKIKTMLEKECFEENLLITTSCLDAGTNIVDERVKYIIADITDIGSLIQCLGRKRSQSKDDTVSFYIKTINNQRLSGLKQSINKDIEMAEFLRNNSTQDLINKYPRQIDSSRIIYDDTKLNNQKNMSTKKINYMMLTKKKSNIKLYNALMSVEYGYCKHLAEYLGFKDKDGHYTYKTLSKDHSLSSFLQKYVDDKIVMLQLKDRKPLIDKLNVRSENRKQLKSIESLNAALSEMELSYKVVQFMTNRLIEGKNKKFKQAWKIERTNT